MAKHSFLARLRRVLPLLSELEPEGSTVVTIEAKYGRYQLDIGPEHSPVECRRRGMRLHSRPLVIKGSLPHLVVEEYVIGTVPSKHAVNKQLQATVIIEGVNIQIVDLDGGGRKVHARAAERAALVDIERTLNFAGERGAQKLSEMRKNGILAHSAYQIIQNDILHSLRNSQSEAPAFLTRIPNSRN